MCQTIEQNIVSSLRAEIKKRDDQIVTLKAEITALKTKTDDMEQWTRRGSMRIQGIPESTPGSLDDKLLFLFNTRLKIQPPIAKEEIEVAHRLPRGGAVRAKLSFNARQLKRDKKIADTWVINSKVMVKDLRNRIKNVKCQDDLDKFRNW